MKDLRDKLEKEKRVTSEEVSAILPTSIESSAVTPLVATASALTAALLSKEKDTPDDAISKAYIEGSEDKDEEAAENMPGDRISGTIDAGEVNGQKGERGEWPGNIRIKENEEIEKVEEDNELKKLQIAVEQARMGYAKKDYEVSNVFERIRRIIHERNLQSTPANNSETRNQFNGYKIALTELLDYQIAQLKEKDLSSEELKIEMENLTKYFNQDEKINLYETRTEARAQVMEEKFGHGVGRPVGWLMNGAKKFFHWYTKSEGKGAKGFLKGIGKRSSFNGALVAAGLGLSAVALPGATIGTYAAKQVVGGVATGIGVSRVLEGMYRKKEDNKMMAERKGIMEEIEKHSTPEEKLAKLVEYLQPMSDGYDKDLRRELSNAAKRKSIGIVAGITSAATLGIASHYFNFAGHSSPELMTSHPSAKIPLASSHVSAGASSEVITESTSRIVKESAENIADKAVQSSAEEATGTAKEVAASKIVEHVADLGGVEKAISGDSVWKMIGKHIVDNKEFSALDPEQKVNVIDVLKDRVAEHHAEFGFNNIDKIKIGDKLDFSKLIHSETDFHSIIEHAKNLTPEQLKNIGHNNETILHWVENHHGQSLTSPKVEEILANAQDQSVASPENILHETPTPTQAIPPHGASVGDIPNVAEHSVPAEEALANSAPVSYGGAVIGGALGRSAMDGRTKTAEQTSPGNKSGGEIVNFPTVAERVARKRQKVDLENLKEFNKLAKKYNFVSGEKFIFRAKKSIQAISLNSLENWRVMKDIKFSELESKNGKISVKLVKNIRNLEKYLVSFLGTEVKSRKDESIKGWISRVTKKSLEEENASGIKKAA